MILEGPPTQRPSKIGARALTHIFRGRSVCRLGSRVCSGFFAGNANVLEDRWTRRDDCLLVDMDLDCVGTLPTGGQVVRRVWGVFYVLIPSFFGAPSHLPFCHSCFFCGQESPMRDLPHLIGVWANR